MNDHWFTLGLILSLVVGIIGSVLDGRRRRQKAEDVAADAGSQDHTAQDKGPTGDLASRILRSVGLWLPLLILIAVVVTEIADPVRRWTIAVAAGVIILSTATWWLLDVRKTHRGG
jgi:hypothetical protein